MLSPTAFFFVLILYVILVVLLFKHDPTGLTWQYQGVSIFTTMLGAALIFMLGMFSYQVNPLFKWSDFSITPPAGVARPPIITSMKDFIQIFGICLAICGLVVSAIMFIIYASGNISGVGTGIIITLNVLLVIGVLTLIATQLSKAGDNTITSLVVKLVLYIPCLIVDVINIIKNEYDITTKTSIIVLGIDIALILAIWGLPKIKHFFLNVNGQQLINEPIYMNNSKILGTYENLIADLSGTSNDSKFNYKYALSAWIYVNPQPPNTGESYTQYTSLLNYSNKPNILYKADTNTLLIKMNNNNNEEIIYKTDTFLLQKWNNIIVNYDGGTLDIFINNKLVVSQGSVVPYMSYDQITSGSSIGIQGGICNVKYFHRVLNFNEIKQIYHYSKNKNPPII